MERCATGEHRGDTLLECAARLQASMQHAIDLTAKGYENFLAVQNSARALWPHLCVACCGMPLCAAGRECWEP